MLKHTLLMPLLLLGTLLSAQTTVVDVVVNSDDHTLLEAAVLEADLAGALSGNGPFTVFAPTDAAFTTLIEALEISTDDLLALPNLADILLYHVVEAAAMSTDLSDGQMVTTMLGSDVTVSVMGSSVMINDANVTVANIAADNGVVHVIDAVLMPPTPVETTTVVDVIVNSDDHTLLEAAVGAAGLVEALSGEGPFTVFAPTDAAVTALVTELGITADELLVLEGLQEILLYHVVEAAALSTDLSDGQVLTTMLAEDITITIMDGTVMVNEATVTTANITTDNGVVHVIDAVLVPPTPEIPPNVAEIIAGSADHFVLASLLDSTGLDETLSGAGPFTVFAPTDAAFDAIPPFVLLDILMNNDLLTDILTYHVAGGSVMSADLSDGQVITTVNGADVTISIDADGAVTVNDALVIVPDLEGSNGVVHVIDAVLNPPAPTPATVVDIVVNSADHTVLETAVIAAGLADDLSAEGPFTVFAPTDAAFAALPDGALETLLADPTGDLATLLLYHVAGTNALSTDLSDGQLVATLQGDEVEVSVDGMSVMVNNANVVVANLVADNGVVHVIDAVLSLPTGVETLNLSDLFQVYPNPTTDLLRWNGIAVDRIQVLDAQGRVRMDTTNPSNSIDLSALESGVFMVVIEAKGQRAVKSVLKH